MQKLILASTSPYRAEALRRIGLPFTVQAPHVEESALASEAAADLALRLAHAKAAAVAAEHANAVVIGSDQVGDCNGVQLSKPGQSEAAVAQLSKLSGQQATFYTAVAVHAPGRNLKLGEVVTTQLHFRTLSEAEIRQYVSVDNPIDCAGSFKVEALGITLFERVTADDPTALVGLPMIALLHQLAACGINPLQPA